MKHLICNETGVLIFIPENSEDSVLLYRLINSPDLNHFSTYVELENKIKTEKMTADLGVHVDNIEYYPLISDGSEHNPDWWLNNWDRYHNPIIRPCKTNIETPDSGNLPDEERHIIGKLVLYGIEDTEYTFYRGTDQTEKPVSIYGYMYN